MQDEHSDIMPSSQSKLDHLNRKLQKYEYIEFTIVISNILPTNFFRAT